VIEVYDNPRHRPVLSPDVKWNSYDGHSQLWPVVLLIRRCINERNEMDLDSQQMQTRLTRYLGAYDSYLDGRPHQGYGGDPEDPDAYRLVQWARRNVEGRPAPLSMTFGQMFEAELARRGCIPFSSGPNSTYWAGSFYNVDTGDMVEGYSIKTGVEGWWVVYRENRDLGLTWGHHSNAAKSKITGKGWWTRVASSVFHRDVSYLTITSHSYWPVNEQWPTHRYVERDLHYRRSFGCEGYAMETDRVRAQAAIAADFLNDRDFHMLEDAKRALRRLTPGGVSSWGMSSSELLVTPEQREWLREAMTFTGYLHIDDCYETLLQVWDSGRWDVERDDQGNALLDPRYALDVGEYPHLRRRQEG